MQRKGLSKHLEIVLHVSLAKDRSKIIIILQQAKKDRHPSANQTNAAKHQKYLFYFL